MGLPSDVALNHAIMNIGEALAKAAEYRQRGLLPENSNYAEPILSLRKAIAALEGELYVPPVALQHARKES